MKEREQSGPVKRFRGVNVAEFRADLIVEQAVIVEIKAVQKLDLSHEKQLLNLLTCHQPRGRTASQFWSECSNPQIGSGERTQANCAGALQAQGSKQQSPKICVHPQICVNLRE